MKLVCKTDENTLIVSLLQGKWRGLAKGSIHSTFTIRPSRDLKSLITAKWPIELDDMVCMVLIIRIDFKLTIQRPLKLTYTSKL